MQPKISVIVPVYNNEATVLACTSSILTQTFTDFELLLIDDGSQDNTLTVLEEIHKRDARVHLFKKENGGQGSARNVGITHARGEYISFVDADDTVDESFLEVLYTNARETNSDISVCGMRLLKDNIDLTPDKHPLGRITFPRICAIQQMLLEHYLFFSVCDKLYHRKLFDNLRFEEGVIHEDILFPYLAVVGCKNIVCQMLPLYNYIQDGESTTRAPFSEARLNDIIARDKLLELVLRDFPELYECGLNTELVGYLNIINLLIYSPKEIKSRYLTPLIKVIRKDRKKFLSNPYINKNKKAGIRLLLLNISLYKLVYSHLKKQ